MNKAELVQELQSRLPEGTTKAETERTLEALIESIKVGLHKDGNVQLVREFTFKVRERKAREGRNPQTGETIKIPASKTVVLVVGSALKEFINSAKKSGSSAPKAAQKGAPQPVKKAKK